MDREDGGRQPRVFIVILNWNGWEDTVQCLKSVLGLDYTNRRILVIDNGSEDGSEDMIGLWVKRAGGFAAHSPTEFGSYSPDEPLPPNGWEPGPGDGPKIELVQAKENLGFTGGCNLGIKRALEAGAEYVFLLNNDARVRRDTLTKLVGTAVEAGAAMAGARILDSENGRVIFSGSRWPAELFGPVGPAADGTGPAYWPSSYASGCALLLRRDLLLRRTADFGSVLDERFFMYWEELDLCLYGAKLGHSCIVVRDAVVLHSNASSSGGGGNPRSFYYLTRNRIFVANRWLGLTWKILFHLYYAPSRVVLQAFRALRKGRLPARAVFEGLVDGYLGVSGKWARHGGRHTYSG